MTYALAVIGEDLELALSEPHRIPIALAWELNAVALSVLDGGDDIRPYHIPSIPLDLDGVPCQAYIDFIGTNFRRAEFAILHCVDFGSATSNQPTTYYLYLAHDEHAGWRLSPNVIIELHEEDEHPCKCLSLQDQLHLLTP